MKLESNSDTWTPKQPLTLTISITNSTNQTVLVPKKSSFYSNLLPNGLENPVYPAAIRFSITPVKPWTAITIENNTLVQAPKMYSKLKPGKTQVYAYDLAKHFDRILESNWDEISDLLPENSLDIGASFGCFYEANVPNEKRIVGTIKSDTISLKILK